jgi:formate hydrogenlyase subunit 6/NADH:ubiquinone oxidoreductase subunit I
MEAFYISDSNYSALSSIISTFCCTCFICQSACPVDAIRFYFGEEFENYETAVERVFIEFDLDENIIAAYCAKIQRLDAVTSKVEFGSLSGNIKDLMPDEILDYATYSRYTHQNLTKYVSGMRTYF